MATSTSVQVPVSVGELIDKLTILAIKDARIGDAAKRVNVRTELEALEAVALAAGLRDLAGLAELEAQLRQVNGDLWTIEDRIRDCERQGDFGPAFVALARAVYVTNDRRAALKRQINALSGSELVEEKSYAAY
ncbi:hypothetical protein [Vulcanococcus limneticus]|uniref:hypothetical protein n=1 Tax=Vulcanococcus limneticus TaxID=2170428 RepID=UPI00398C0739